MFIPGTEVAIARNDAGDKTAPGQKGIEVFVNDPLAATCPRKSGPDAYLHQLSDDIVVSEGRNSAID